MSEPIDVTDLIAWAKELGDPDFTLSVPGHAKAAFRKMANALESTASELRQERERLVVADRQFTKLKEQTGAADAERIDLKADLARAREVIEYAQVAWASGRSWTGPAVGDILATYDTKEEPGPQGEPSDTQVLAALNAYRPWLDHSLAGYREVDMRNMRAALRAAAQVKP